MKLVKLSSISILFVISSFAALSGCSDDSAQRERELAAAEHIEEMHRLASGLPEDYEQKQKEKEEAERKARENAKPFTYKKEVYGDKEVFKYQRLQFLWKYPDCEQERPGLWSIRLDGSDPRLVVEPELLFSNGVDGSINPAPLRSPDNRYIVYSVPANGTIEKRLLDLKTRKIKVITTGGFRPHFNWTPDSKHIIFYTDPGLMDYNVETGELKVRKHIPSAGLFLVKDGSEFFAITSDGFAFYDYEGNLLRTGKIEDPQNSRSQYHYAISSDGKYYMYRRGSKYIVVDTSKPDEIIYMDKHRRSESIYFDKDNKYLFSKRHGIERVDLKTKEHISIFHPLNPDKDNLDYPHLGCGYSDLSLYNLNGE